MAKEIARRITVDPDIMVGKPVVKGTRIPVYVILGKLAENPDLDDLFAAYPRLTIDDVKACLAYAEHLVARKRVRQSTQTVASKRTAQI